MKLRHYGLLAPGNVNTKLVAARTVLERRAPASPSLTPAPLSASAEPPEGWRELLLRLTGVDVTRCRKCGGTIHSRPLERPPPKDSS